MQDCDTLLMVGTSFPYSEFLPARRPGARRPDRHRAPACSASATRPRCNLVGRRAGDVARADAPPGPQGGPPLARGRSRRTWPSGGQLLEARAMNDADPDQPAAGLLGALAAPCPTTCILASDSGSAANWYMRDLKVRPGMMASLSGNLATMGPGVPYVIAAKFAHPDRPGDRPGRRRRDADERHQRPDHHRQVLEATGRIPRLIDVRAQQPAT